MKSIKFSLLFFIIEFLLILYGQNANSQISADLMKYWYYRKRLEYFVVPGYKWGESQIICVRNRILSDNDPTDDYNNYAAKNVDYGQHGKYTALYLGTLATEYYLLKINGQYDDAAKTAYELYLALYAIQEYWDRKAEEYWPGWQPYNPNFTDPLNGFFTRGNVPCDFFSKDNSNVYNHGYTTSGERHLDLLNQGLDSNCVFDLSEYRFKNSNNGYLPRGHPGYIDHRTSDLCFGVAEDPDVPNFDDEQNPERMSQDEAIGLMLGMALTIKLADDNVAYNNNGTVVFSNSRQLAISLYDKIVRYCINRDKINGENSFRIFDPNHDYDFDGSSTYYYGKGFITAGNAMTGYDYGHVNEVYQNICWSVASVFGNAGGAKNSSMTSTLAAIGNSWTNTSLGIEIISEYNNSDTFYLLLWEVLNNLRRGNEKQKHLLDKTLDQLNNAPCEGPYCYKPETESDDSWLGDGFYSSGMGWASSYKWNKEQEKQDHGDDYIGNYNGLDYMLLYNLYHIINSQYCPYYVNYVDRNLVGYMPGCIQWLPSGSDSIEFGTITHPTKFVAFNTLTSTQTIGIQTQPIVTDNPGNVTYVASTSIHLKPGFHATEGCYFHAYIDDLHCNEYLGGSKDTTAPLYPNNMYTPYYDSLISLPKTPYDLEVEDTGDNDFLALECPVDTLKFKGINGDTIDEVYTYYWDFGNGITSTEVDPVVYYQPGTYNFTLILTDTNGVADTMKIVLEVPDCGTQTGTQEQTTSSSASDAAISIVPNPNNGEMWLLSKGTHEEGCRLVIYDITGRAVYRKPIPLLTGKIQISASGLLNGVYLYTVISEHGNLIAKDKLVIINK